MEEAKKKTPLLIATTIYIYSLHYYLLTEFKTEPIEINYSIN